MDVPHTSPKTLAKASAGAAIAAAAVFTMFVLPAESAIDPTGIGTALGLTRMAPQEEPEAAPEPTPAATPAKPAAALAIPDKASIAKSGALRSDEMRITLAPHSGTEVKAHMNAGDHLVFRWEAKGGPVKVDLHGERTNAPDGEFTGYWEERELTESQGSLTAPFTGTHGWYWRNRGETPVTITVRTTGFYKDLFRPVEG